MTAYVHDHKIAEGTYPVARGVREGYRRPGSATTARSPRCPLDKVSNARNDMYLASEAIAHLAKDKENGLKPEETRR